MRKSKWPKKIDIAHIKNTYGSKGIELLIATDINSCIDECMKASKEETERYKRIINNLKESHKRIAGAWYGDF